MKPKIKPSEGPLWALGYSPTTPTPKNAPAGKKSGVLRPSATEYALAKTVAHYLAMLEARQIVALYTHIPNEGKRSLVYGARLKQMGMRPGWPDVEVVMPWGRVGYIELKRSGREKLSLGQIKTHLALAEAGVPVIVAHKLEQVEAFILEIYRRDGKALPKMPLFFKG